MVTLLASPFFIRNGVCAPTSEKLANVSLAIVAASSTVKMMTAQTSVVSATFGIHLGYLHVAMRQKERNHTDKEIKGMSIPEDEHAKATNIAPPVYRPQNRAGADMKAGSNGSTLYCGRRLGRAIIPGSGGQSRRPARPLRLVLGGRVELYC